MANTYCNVLFRVDGSPTIGMGHVMRCLYLARQLARQRKMTVAFAVKENPWVMQAIQAKEYEIFPLPAESSAEEVSRVQEILRSFKADCVITDLRSPTEGLWESIQTLGILSVVIDEWGSKSVPSDLLTNGTIVPAWHRYQPVGDVTCLLGPEYALLDEQFATLHQQERPKHSGIPQVLIALGGDDPFFLTLKALQAAERLANPVCATVVIGPAFTNGRDIREAAARSKHSITVYENVTNMAELMFQADVAITAGGLIALELACSGTPGLILCEVDHQLDTAAVLEAAGAALHLGLGTELSEKKLEGYLSGLLQDKALQASMQQAGKQLIDGKGTARITQAILDKLETKVYQ